MARSRVPEAMTRSSQRSRGIPLRGTSTSATASAVAATNPRPSSSSTSSARVGTGLPWSMAAFEAARGLADLHCARAHLKWRGFSPWQQLLQQSRLNALKAQQWRRDRTLAACWLTWQQQRQDAKVHRRRAKGAAVCWTSDMVERRVQSRAWLHWRATCADLAHRAVAVRSNRAYHRGRAVLELWREAAHYKRQALRRKVRAVQDLSVKHRQRCVLEQWGVALAKKRAANAAAEKKAARWKQVKGWLGEE